MSLQTLLKRDCYSVHSPVMMCDKLIELSPNLPCALASYGLSARVLQTCTRIQAGVCILISASDRSVRHHHAQSQHTLSASYGPSMYALCHASYLQVPDLVSTIKAHPNEKLDFQVQRGKQILDIKAKPAAGKDGTGAIGVSLLSHTYIKHTKPSSLVDSFAMAGSEFNRLAGSVTTGLKNIVTNFGGMAGQLSGPVAIVAAGSEIARTDAAGLYQFCAIVNINLAVVNILPLPALDGGYLLFLLLEAARGKKLPETLEQGVMTSGLLLMMVLGVGLAIRDTINLAVR